MTAEAFVADYIRRLHGNLSASDIAGPSTGALFTRQGEGSLYLSPTEAWEFATVVSRLTARYVKHDDLSRRSVERYLQDAVFSALDIQSRSTAAFDTRLEEAVSELRRRLSQPTTDYTCWVPLCGLADEGLPGRIGGLRLVRMNERQFHRLWRADRRGAPRADQGVRSQLIASIKLTDTWNRAAAIVTVQARDTLAASCLAEHETRRAVDVLNFFSEMVPYNAGYIYLPGEAGVYRVARMTVGPGDTPSLSLGIEGPLQPFSLRALRDAPFLRPALRRVEALMREPGGPLAEVLLTSIQWAGRASVEATREQGFLLLAVALETLMLPEESRQELTYRLRIRVASLLGKDHASRADLSATIRDLYKVRSEIAHSGSYEVSEEDLGRLRSIVKQCILRALLHRRIRQFTTKEELFAWFESRVL